MSTTNLMENMFEIGRTIQFLIDKKKIKIKRKNITDLAFIWAEEFEENYYYDHDDEDYEFDIEMFVYDKLQNMNLLNWN